MIYVDVVNSAGTLCALIHEKASSAEIDDAMFHLVSALGGMPWLLSDMKPERKLLYILALYITTDNE